MKVGIIGCGFIGTEISRFIDKDKRFRLVGLNDIEKTNFFSLIKKIRSRPKFMEINELIKKCDVIIEAASRNAVKEILKNRNLDQIVKKLIMMSSGGLINNLTLLKKIKKCEIFVPSGAISGLDSIKSISERLNSLTLTTTKPVAGLNNAPYILKNKINLNKIKSKKTIFSGNLSEAVSGFPKNINVAATLFLATGFKHIEIKIIADPKTKSNTHEIEAIGKFEKIKTITISLPGENPKSSYLAVLSAINLLDNIKNNKRIGN